jgi:glycosyltransferase involved in cell wall biosynthesis
MQLVGGTGGASPTVSIITPAFNAAAYLDEAIRSAIEQTFDDFELWIVDDGSTDVTLSIARLLADQDARVNVITTDHVGVAAARNAAMQRARGQYFAMLDSDDVWLPAFLSAQMGVFERMPATDVVVGNAYNLGGAQDGRPLRPVSSECRSISLLDMIEHEDAVCIMSVFRRSVFEATGGIDERLRRSEDYDFWLRAALLGFRFIENPEPLVRYRRRADSASANEIAMLDAIIGVLDRTGRKNADRHAVVAAVDRKIATLRERRLLTSAKANLLRREYAAAAGDFDRLSGMRQSLASRLIAGASRRAPAVLRLAYQTKSALRV